MKEQTKDTLMQENARLNERIVFLEDILNKAPVSIYINELDQSNTIIASSNVWANQRTLDFIGYTQQELQQMGNTFYEQVMHPDDLCQTQQSLQHLSDPANEPVYRDVCRIKTKDNDYQWVNKRTNVFSSTPDGAPLQLIHTAFDLRATIHTDNQLNEALKEINRHKNYNKLSQITKREREILKRIAKGMTDRDIANSLCISERTAQTHRNNLIKKTQTPNTASLVAFAIECGLD